MEKTLDKFIKNDSFSWPLFVSDYNFETQGRQEDDEKRIHFLTHKFSFGYDSPYNNRFNPFIVMGGKRSAVYEDLCEEDFLMLEKITQQTSNDFLLAKIHDVMYIKSGDILQAKKAISHLKKIVDYYIEKEKVFSASYYVKRILFIMNSYKAYEDISNYFDELIIAKAYKNVHDFSLIANAAFDFLKTSKYTKCDKKKYIPLLEQKATECTDSGLELIENIIDYYSSTHELQKQNVWLNKYADFCEKMSAIRSPHGYSYINKAIEYLSKQSDANFNRINDLEFKSEEEQAKFYDSMVDISIPIGEEIEQKVNENLNKAIDIISRQPSSAQKLITFLGIFRPIKNDELETFSSGMDKSAVMSVFRGPVFDENKRIIDEIDPNDKEKRKKHNIVQAYAFYHEPLLRLAAQYISCLNVDEELIELVKEVVSHNEFVPRERIEVVCETIVNGLNKNIKQSIFNLIAQFEYGCVLFLRKRKIYPMVKKGSKKVAADLNHILTMDNFKNQIADIVGEDLTKELQYLLVDKQYGNLRNRSYHQGQDNLNSLTKFELLSFFKIVNAYFMGYDKDI